MQHDVDYIVCGDYKECKHRADQRMVRALDGLGGRGVKVNVTLYIQLDRKIEDGETFHEFKNVYFNSKTCTITNSDQIPDSLDGASEEILNRIAGWISEGSGWTIGKILKLRNPKKDLINPKNQDHKCFLWCHVRHLNPQKKDPQRIRLSDREFANGLDYSGITFPVTINQIPKIEKQSKININLFGYQKGFFPIRISKEKYPDHMELLCIEEDEKQHYVYMKDFNRTMFTSTGHEHEKHYYMHCLKNFRTNEISAKHRKDCIVTNSVQAVELHEPYIDQW